VGDLLLAWFAEHGRDLPWRRTRDPYAILVSEAMSQQYRVENEDRGGEHRQGRRLRTQGHPSTGPPRSADLRPRLMLPSRPVARNPRLRTAHGSQRWLALRE